MATTTLSEKGQLVIPAEIRTRLGLQRGDRFEIEVRDGEVILRPLPRNPLLAMRGALKGSESLVEALLRERAAERRVENG